jgi:hypothetical protein
MGNSQLTTEEAHYYIYLVSCFSWPFQPSSRIEDPTQVSTDVMLSGDQADCGLLFQCCFSMALQLALLQSMRWSSLKGG